MRTFADIIISHRSGAKPSTKRIIVAAGQKIISIGDKMDHILMMLSGEVLTEGADSEGRPFSHVLKVEVEKRKTFHLFGARPYMTRGFSKQSYCARTQCELLTIDSNLIKELVQDGHNAAAFARQLMCASDISASVVRLVLEKLRADGIHIPDPESVTGAALSAILRDLSVTYRNDTYKDAAIEIIYRLLEHRTDVAIKRRKNDPEATEPSLVFENPNYGSVEISRND